MVEFPELHSIKWEKLCVDDITPVQAFRCIKNAGYKDLCLFESVIAGGKRGRYSVISIGREFIWRLESSVARFGSLNLEECDNAIESLKILHKNLQIELPKEIPNISYSMFGYFNYDIMRLLENIPDENSDNINIPDGYCILPQLVMIFDIAADDLFLISPIWRSHCAKDISQEIKNVMRNTKSTLIEDCEELNLSFESNYTQDQYEALVLKCKEYIIEGDIFQVLPSRRVEVHFPHDPFALYRSLRNINPSPYMFFFEIEDIGCLVGSSPEIVVQVKNNKVTIRPLAGTRARGRNDEEDKVLARELLNDQKERAEHLMLIDLSRNDVARVCVPGSVKVTSCMEIEHYSHVMHISSTVEGDLSKDFDAVDALMVGIPLGTVSGAPKVRSMEIIEAIENTKRSFYAGCVGYFSASGEMDTCVMLRTACIKDAKLYTQAAAGVVYDSNPTAEYKETQKKMMAIIQAAHKSNRFFE